MERHVLRRGSRPQGQLRKARSAAPLTGGNCGRRPNTKAGPPNIHTASFAALTGRALTVFRAGLALNIIRCPLKGFVAARALVAGFLMTMTTNLANPWRRRGIRVLPPTFVRPTENVLDAIVESSTYRGAVQVRAASGVRLQTCVAATTSEASAVTLAALVALHLPPVKL